LHAFIDQGGSMQKDSSQVSWIFLKVFKNLFIISQLDNEMFLRKFSKLKYLTQSKTKQNGGVFK